jgi:hypothetical protein
MKKFFILLTVLTVLTPIGKLNAADEVDKPAGKSGVSSGQVITLQNPIGEDDPRKILGNILKTVLGLVGSLALVVFVYGGLTWMTSAGNSDRVKSGRDTLIWAGIGLIVIFASYTIVAFILQTIIQT